MSPPVLNAPMDSTRDGTSPSPTPARVQRADRLGTGRDKPVPYARPCSTRQQTRNGTGQARPLRPRDERRDEFGRILVGAGLVPARIQRADRLDTGRDKPVPYARPCSTRRQTRHGTGQARPLRPRDERRDEFGRILVGAGLVPARVQRADRLDTGRDKPVPYARPCSTRRWTRNGTGQARPLRLPVFNAPVDSTRDGTSPSPTPARVQRADGLDTGLVRSSGAVGLDGRVVMQRTATPCTPVRFRLQPPKNTEKIVVT